MIASPLRMIRRLGSGKIDDDRRKFLKWSPNQKRRKRLRTSRQQPERPQVKEEEEKCSLLHQLGGMEALSSIANDFVSRWCNDPRLQTFVERSTTHKRVLFQHPRLVFQLALTANPDDMQTMQQYFRKTHSKLFDLGLNEEHFDIIVQHLRDSFQCRNFPTSIIDEIVAILQPLRCLLEEEHAHRQPLTKGRRSIRLSLRAFQPFYETELQSMKRF